MGNLPGHQWITRAYPDGERNLIAAIIQKAARDARSARDATRDDALAYLNGRNFEADCAWLDLDPARIRRLLKVKS